MTVRMASSAPKGTTNWYWTIPLAPYNRFHFPTMSSGWKNAPIDWISCTRCRGALRNHTSLNAATVAWLRTPIAGTSGGTDTICRGPYASGADTLDVDASAVLGDGETSLRACDITTAAYPGLATDLQPPTCILLTQARGRSVVHETIFEDRLEWLTEIRRMGAAVEIVDPHHAIISGPANLSGAHVEIGDLRAGASLILAALAARGESVIHGAHHVHRGYENIEGKFVDLGASIERLADGTAPRSA